MIRKLAASILFCAMLALSPSNLFAATVSIGHYFSTGPTITIPVLVTGGELIKEMDGVLVVGDGGSVIGSAPVPKITTVSYATSIWVGPVDGYTASHDIFDLPSELYFPNVALNSSSASVAASGQLLNFTLNLNGFPLGSTFALSMEHPPSSSATQFKLADDNFFTPTFVNGSITIVPEPSTVMFTIAIVALSALGMQRKRAAISVGS